MATTVQYWIRFIIATSLASGVALGLVGEASAVADYKVHPGTLCVERATTTPSIAYNRLRATNGAAGDRSWACPVLRDVEAGDVVDWSVTVHRGGNTTDDWSITLQYCDLAGSTCDAEAADWVEVPKIDGVQTLISEVNFVAQYETFQPLVMWSSVPHDCRIYSYMIGEE